MHDLIIAGVLIVQDEQGRYNLNALHQASEQANNPGKSPSQWLRRKSTLDLLQVLQSQDVNLHLETIHGGERAGTYAHELLAVEYAGWISPAFRLKVNQAFIDSRKAPTRDVPVVHNPQTAALIQALLQADQAEQLAREAKRDAEAADHKALEATRQALEADHKALLALKGQQWITIRQYVEVYALQRQMPDGYKRDFGRWLTGYCRDRGIPVYEARSLEQWDEHTYPVTVIQDTLAGWLHRRTGQTTLRETA